MTSPCYECEKRKPGCHDACAAYLKYRAKADILRKKRNEQNEIENYFISTRAQRKKLAFLMKKR